MLVKLLNDGGFGDMENVKFPVVVEGVDYEGHGCTILGRELVRAGASNENYNVWDLDYSYYFNYGTACEAVNEK